MSARVAVICGDHPRNLFFAETINSNLNLVGALIQERENMIPHYPSFCSKKDKSNYIKHFENRKIYEEKYLVIIIHYQTKHKKNNGRIYHLKIQ